MESVNVISNGAAAISTFGIYAIMVVLGLVVVHLYKRVNTLEDKLREAVEKSAEERGKELVKWQETTTKIQEAANQMQEVVKANTTALEKVREAIENGRW